YPQVDAIFVASAQRVEWMYLMHDGRAPAELAWRVALPEGLPKVRSETSGALVFADAGGNARLRIPPPYAVDARGARREAELSFDGARLRVRLDATGLSFPVLLDPAVETAVWEDNTPAPGAKLNAALAYDSLRGRAVLFGGSSSGGVVWEWDGNVW